MVDENTPRRFGCLAWAGVVIGALLAVRVGMEVYAYHGADSAAAQYADERQRVWRALDSLPMPSGTTDYGFGLSLQEPSELLDKLWVREAYARARHPLRGLLDAWQGSEPQHWRRGDGAELEGEFSVPQRHEPCLATHAALPASFDEVRPTPHHPDVACAFLGEVGDVTVAVEVYDGRERGDAHLLSVTGATGRMVGALGALFGA